MNDLRQLDRQVATAIGYEYGPHVPHYSTDLKDAWSIVEHMTFTDGPQAEQDWSFGLEYSSAIDWVADFTPRAGHPKAREYPAFQASGRTAAEAISRAFLAAKEHQP